MKERKGANPLIYKVLAPFCGWNIRFKEELHQLLHYYPNILVFRWNWFRRNFLKPIGHPIQYFFWLARILKECLGKPNASEWTFVHYALLLYRKWDALDEGSKVIKYPNFFDLQELLFEKMKGKGVSSKEKAKIDTWHSIVSELTTGLGGVLNCSIGYSWHDIMSHSVIFSLRGLSQNLQRFLISMVLLPFREELIAQPIKDALTHAIFIDECKLMLGQGHISFFKELLTTLRGEGCGIVLADNSPSSMPQWVHENLQVVLYFQQSSKSGLAQALNMTCAERQHKPYLYGLLTGQAFVRKAGYAAPILVKTPKFEKGTYIAREELYRRMLPLIRELRDDNGNSVSIANDLKQEYTVFLKFIQENSEMNFSQLCDAFQISRRKGEALKQELKNRGLIKIEYSKTEGRPAMKLRLTEYGKKLLKGVKEVKNGN